MLNKVIQDAVNEQIRHEFYSSYLYLSMSAYCEASNLRGFSHWMRRQSQEEVAHAIKLFDFIVDRGGRVTLQSIDKPPVEFQSPFDVFQDALEHERHVTAMIHRLYELVIEEKDYATQVQLQWFIAEQVEEEKRASEVVEQMKMIKGENAPLLLLDRQLASR